jgi:hypothetical protein
MRNCTAENRSPFFHGETDASVSVLELEKLFWFSWKLEFASRDSLWR